MKTLACPRYRPLPSCPNQVTNGHDNIGRAEVDAHFCLACVATMFNLSKQQRQTGVKDWLHVFREFKVTKGF